MTGTLLLTALCCLFLLNLAALFAVKLRMDRKIGNAGVWLAPFAALKTPEFYALFALLGVGVLLFRALRSLQSP